MHVLNKILEEDFESISAERCILLNLIQQLRQGMLYTWQVKVVYQYSVNVGYPFCASA